MTDKNQTTTSENSRRRFLKGAAAASPVIMTVASRPVQGALCTPSAWVSGNLSDNGPNTARCGGRSPGYWKARPEKWAGSGFIPGTCKDEGIYTSTCTMYKGDGTQFNGVFTMGNTYYDGKTLMQVLWLEGHEDPYKLGAHIVAALLNAATIPNYGMTVLQVKEIYHQLVTTGSFHVDGKDLFAQDVVDFIQNTFD